MDKRTYFVLTNQDRRTVQAGEEVLITYGAYNNFHFLQHYGYCMEKNRFESFKFTLRFNPFDLQIENLIVDRHLPQ
jgi:hypothetical protein